ncbi:hypothetical protein PR048_007631 [Dryococelus australis]|uniref:Uncharacterized protein n=1 Tax=Dryococelus australis TaxID=614101 RepID=A0ABQ9HVM7_9NEOP|nr:hypothetical protein PR048_007631 [Dryococelus australis]
MNGHKADTKQAIVGHINNLQDKPVAAHAAVQDVNTVHLLEWIGKVWTDINIGILRSNEGEAKVNMEQCWNAGAREKGDP